MSVKPGLWIKGILVSALFGILAAAFPLQAQEDPVREVTVTGESVLEGDNVAVARDRALQAAFRNAVEQVVGIVVRSESEMRDFELVRDEIYSQSKGFVQNYEIVSEAPSGDGAYKVTIRARVSTKVLQDSIRDMVDIYLVKNSNKPRTMIFLKEQNVGDTTAAVESANRGGRALVESISMGTVENSMTQVLTDNGFPMIDPQTVSKQIAVVGAIGAADITDAQAKKLGELTKAEIVIYGNAFSKAGNQIPGTPLHTVSGGLSIKVVHTDTGKIIASETRSGTGSPHISAATAGENLLKKMGTESAAVLMPKIIRALTQDGSVNLVIKFQNMRFGDWVAFKKELRNSSSKITAIADRPVEGSQRTYELTVSRGTATDLAEEIYGHEFPGFEFEVVDTTQNIINATLKKK
ncbi:MAG: flagellar assembly protein T N-terminal domain-containing protein [Deltaproteobacteria bacterium]|nr:flagellar assembly protein T N-terminal domain-containing protein [Deltaproteobacteria bacterium]